MKRNMKKNYSYYIINDSQKGTDGKKWGKRNDRTFAYNFKK